MKGVCVEVTWVAELRIHPFLVGLFGACMAPGGNYTGDLPLVHLWMVPQTLSQLELASGLEVVTVVTVVVVVMVAMVVVVGVVEEPHTSFSLA